MKTLNFNSNADYIESEISEAMKVYESSVKSYNECFELLNTSECAEYKTLLKGWSDILTEVSEKILRLHSAL